MPVPRSPDIEPLLIRYVESWVEKLAAGDWDGAMSLVEAPNHYGIRWSSADLRQTLVEYGHGREPKVIAPQCLNQGLRVSVIAFDDGTGYAVDYALPLDGLLSDLTAQFEFYLSGSEYVATLHDVHVL
ncbi:hypothetical protein NU688_12380 [Variovorax sp. ZS18.2.2]|uniref:DUF7668 domain-containing protein n=1 Tax=Variovorax sp. ZS18.2.2 TaxID=2971255 RepID=UPI0021510AB0|nr:hypothetical protein [Variovorax sp. ZS18.2.2]MCR6476949.1 hypothetical protein [Variovorax sp. ZS18.2.2]